jgi:hypothetical protein
MTTAAGHDTRTRSTLMRFPGGGFGYRHPRTIGATQVVVGVWLVVLGAILCWGGYWWGVSLFVMAALLFWIARDILQSSARS